MFNPFRFLWKKKSSVAMPALPSMRDELNAIEVGFSELPPIARSEPKTPKTKADIIRTAFDNEHAAGIKCTLTFSDDTYAIAVMSGTGNLAKDQAAAVALALQFANT